MFLCLHYIFPIGPPNITVFHVIVTMVALRDVSIKQFPGNDLLEIALNEKLH